MPALRPAERASWAFAITIQMNALDAGLGTATRTSPPDISANQITVFNDRVRVDVQTSTRGPSFADAWRRRQTVAYQDQEFVVLS